MRELLIRIAVSVVGIPLIIFLILKGGVYFFALIMIVSIVGQCELYALIKSKSINALKTPGIITGVCILYMAAFGLNNYVLCVLLILIMFIFASEMFRNKGSAVLNIAGALLGVVYPVLFLAAFLILRMNIDKILPAGHDNAGGYFIVTIFISVWICDTFAYFYGTKFGRHKLFERVSPKKSIEGGAAGLIGAVLTFLAVNWLEIVHIPLPIAVISGLIVGILGQLGDLVESWFKRDVQIKDSSHILPGHGGILDRFDSLTFIAPAFLILYLLWS